MIIVMKPGFMEGLIVEVHSDLRIAWSDAAQQLDPE